MNSLVHPQGAVGQQTITINDGNIIDWDNGEEEDLSAQDLSQAFQIVSYQ